MKEEREREREREREEERGKKGTFTWSTELDSCSDLCKSWYQEKKRKENVKPSPRLKCHPKPREEQRLLPPHPSPM